MTNPLFTQNTDPQEDFTIEELDDQVDYLAELVGDGKKFRDTQSLAKGKKQSDQFIAQLQREAAALRQELKQRTTLEELLTRMNSGNKPVEPNPEGTPAPVEVDVETKVKQMLTSALSEQQENVKRETNLNFVVERLTETFGTNYPQVLKERTKELGVTEEYMTNLAQSQPRVFLKLVNDTPSTSPGKSSPNLFSPKPVVSNERNFSGTNAGVKDWKYYENIRKTDVNRYYKPEVQNEMFKQLAELGEEKFYNRR